MTINIDAFIGRANSREITFLEDRDTNTAVPDSTITRVVIKLGANCLDTDSVTDPIALTNNNTKLYMQLGLWEHATESAMQGHIVVYTAEHPEGLAWPEDEDLLVTFYGWEVCV